MQFAETFPTEAEMSNALDIYPSWREVAKALKRIPDPGVSTGPRPVPKGQFGTIVADPPWR